MHMEMQKLRMESPLLLIAGEFGRGLEEDEKNETMPTRKKKERVRQDFAHRFDFHAETYNEDFAQFSST